MTILRRGTVALVAMLTLLVGTVAQAQVASQIPNDALMVIKVKSLSGTSAKIGAYLGQLGVWSRRRQTRLARCNRNSALTPGWTRMARPRW